MSQNQCGITVLLIFLIIATIPIALGATPLTTDQNRVLTYADNGTTISLEKGETFCLQLIENPSTGYSWQLNLSKGLKVVKEKIIQGSSRSVGDSLQQDVASLNSIPISGSSPISGIIVGAPKTHIWIIQAVDYGYQDVKGIYKRPWEQTTWEDQTFKLKVKVKNMSELHCSLVN